MRSILLLCLLFSFSVGWSQSLPEGGILSTPGDRIAPSEMTVQYRAKEPKWFVTSGVNVVSAISFYHRTPTSWLAIPASIQLNHRLSDHWYAFANLSASPIYQSLLPAGGILSNKSLFANPLNPRGLGVYSAATIGVYYTNEARTFSISGSLSTSRGYSPFMGISPLNLPATGTFAHPGR